MGRALHDGRIRDRNIEARAELRPQRDDLGSADGRRGRGRNVVVAMSLKSNIASVRELRDAGYSYAEIGRIIADKEGRKLPYLSNSVIGMLRREQKSEAS
jgi:hypothetical protein